MAVSPTGAWNPGDRLLFDTTLPAVGRGGKGREGKLESSVPSTGGRLPETKSIGTRYAAARALEASWTRAEMPHTHLHSSVNCHPGR